MSDAPPAPPRRETRRWIVAAAFGLLALVGAWVGPSAWNASRLQRVWQEEATVIDPNDQPLVGGAGAEGPILGWIEIQRWDGMPTGREAWWYKDSGTLARARFPTGITNFYRADRSQFAQSKTTNHKIPGTTITGGSIEYTLKSPWSSTPESSELMEAPWVAQGMSAAEWWDAVQTQ